MTEQEQGSSGVWLITGASRGLGTWIAREALARGHRVVATGRDVSGVEKSLGSSSDRLLPLRLDVTDDAQIAAAVAATAERFGRIDVLVNNAGYGQMGAFEEISARAVEQQFQTNVFGLFAVTRAVLPLMRRQRSGHVFNISSMVGYQGMAHCSIYAASKFAVSGFSESLAAEVAPFGIKVTVVEPGAFRTDFSDATSSRFGEILIDDYADATLAMHRFIESINHKQRGDPRELAKSLLTLADSAQPPVRFPVGADALRRVAAKHAAVDKEVARWRDLSMATACADVSIAK